jgi:hypothetical protein
MHPQMKRAIGRSTIAVRPTKAMSRGGIVAMSVLLLFGAGFAAIVATVLADNEAPFGVLILFLIFMTGWMGTALVMLVYHIRNLKRVEGVPMFEVEISQADPEGPAEQDTSGGLRRHDEHKR